MTKQAPPQSLSPGDVVFSRQRLSNDGSLPEVQDDATVVEANTRGVLINVGHLEEAPDTRVYLVRFENPSGSLGPPIGCWENEIVGGIAEENEH